MKNDMNKRVLIIILSALFFNTVYTQEIKKKEQVSRIRLGLNYGQASQSNFLFNNRNYFYENNYFKGQINYLLKQQKRVSIELNIEPSIYFSKHQLLNEYFIKPESSPNYLNQREKYTKLRSFSEYVINFGVIYRYNIKNNFSGYAIGGVGPMISNQDTERLKKGFAFSDIIGVGISFKQKNILFDLRMTLRHNSNANLFKPNFGHNSLGFESGVTFQL